MSNIGPVLVTIVASIVGLAIVAVLVSKKAQTPQVLQAGGSALGQIIGAAVGPVTGATGNQFGAATGIGGTTQ